MKLVEVSGARDKIVAAMPAALEDAQQKFTEQCKTCTPEFIAEWKKRVAAQLKPEAFLKICIEEYETYLTDPELKELIQLTQDNAAGKKTPPSPELVAKMTSVMPTLMSKIVGRSSEVGAKLGGDIALQITAEHPEWVKPLPTTVAPKT